MKKLISNHTLTTLVSLFIIVVGVVCYRLLPREQDPSVNLNYVDISTYYPNASAKDVETFVTTVLEKAVSRVDDVWTVISVSRPGYSSIGVRFENISSKEFDKRIIDLRREIQISSRLLPPEVLQPIITKITSSNNLPSIMLVLSADKIDPSFIRTAKLIKKDLEKNHNINQINLEGDRNLELDVDFDPAAVANASLQPVDLADTVSAYFRNTSAGDIDVGSNNWLVRMVGTSSEPTYLENIPILTANGEVPLRSVADIKLGLSEPNEIAAYNGRPAVVLNLHKQDNASVIDLYNEVSAYVKHFNKIPPRADMGLSILFNPTLQALHSVHIMESNALIGLILVVLVSWLFLGYQMSAMLTTGVVISMAATFAIIYMAGYTLNTVVLLGVVIVLGMLVDDAVVVGEAIVRNINHDASDVDSVMVGIREIFLPVCCSVLTTVGSFFPLIFIPGVLGDYMAVIPIVVITALIVSLIEAFWCLPSHALSMNITSTGMDRGFGLKRKRAIQALRRAYTRALVYAFRHPRKMLTVVGAVILASVLLVSFGFVKVDYFANDAMRNFYVGVDAKPGTTLKETLAITKNVEKMIKKVIGKKDLHNTVSYAGMQLRDSTRPRGDFLGQVAVSLVPEKDGTHRSVDDIISAIRKKLKLFPGVDSFNILRVTSGPPLLSPISIKVRGEDSTMVRSAAEKVKEILRGVDGVTDVTDNNAKGGNELTLQLNTDMITRIGLNPTNIIRDVRMMTDGEVVASMQKDGEPLDVRIKGDHYDVQQIDDLLNFNIGLRNGSSIPLSSLVKIKSTAPFNTLNRYNYQRAVTVYGNIDKNKTDVVSVNRKVKEIWQQKHAGFFPGVKLDFTGELDDINNAVNSLFYYFLLGLAIVFVILGSQLRSYVQPFIVLSAVPLAFCGVIFGLACSGAPLSLYTMYGVVANAGVSVNTGIVMLSAANDNVNNGMSTLDAIIYASRRRVIPILISSITTIFGMMSLAGGWAGESVVWGSVASAIIFGLVTSGVLSLFVTPYLYYKFVDTEKITGRIAKKWSLKNYSNIAIVKKVKDMFPAMDLRSKKELEDTQLIEGNPELKGLYDRGHQLLEDGNPWEALKYFEKAIPICHSNTLVMTGALRALILLMEEMGYDEGFSQRAERLLSRIGKLDQNNEALPSLSVRLIKLRSA